MEPSGKNEHFFGYSETSEEFEIYVLGERHIEVSQDVNFHKEAAFNGLKEIECDTNTEEHETPISEDLNNDSFPFDV